MLTGDKFGTWSGPSNVTAKAPLTDLKDCQTFDSRCQHNHYSNPEVDTGDSAPVRGTDVKKLTGWRWDPNGGQFVEVPFQVDKVFTRYLSNPASGFSVYSGEDQHTTYQFQREGFRYTASSADNPCLAVPDSPPATDPVKGLDNNDELAFMAKDAGPQAPSGATRPDGTTGVKAVAVTDPLTRQTSYLYVMTGRTPSFNADNGYVHYQRDANADTFDKSQSSYSGYGNAEAGVYCDAAGNLVRKADGTPDIQRRRPRDTATITTDRYRYRYDGRWLMTDIRVKEDNATTYGPDLVDRWKARAFQQDAESKTPCCGYEEEDTNWGGSSTLLGELSGPVRTIRETWGSDSGTNVVRRETFYRDDMVMKTWLRVHVIPPLDGIYAQWDFNAGVMTKYYNPNKPDGVAVDGKNDEVFGNFDDPCNPKYDASSATSTASIVSTYRDVYKQSGLCTALPYHQSFDVPDPTFSKTNAALDWSVTAGPSGSIVDRYSFEPTSITPGGFAQSVVAVPYYRDDSCFDDGTGSNPGPRLHLRSAGEPTTDPATGLPRRCWTPADGVVDNSTAFYQGDIGAHGVHLLFLADSDNARQTVPVDEIVFSQRQVFLTGERTGVVGEQYGRGFEKPLVATVTDSSFSAAGASSSPSPSDTSPSDTSPSATSSTSPTPTATPGGAGGSSPSDSSSASPSATSSGGGGGGGGGASGNSTPSDSPIPTGTAPAGTSTLVLSPSSTDERAGQAAALTVSGGSPDSAIELRCYSRPNREYRTVRQGRLSSAGSETFAVMPSTNSRCYARYVGNDAHSSPSVVITVHPRLSLTATRTGRRLYTFGGRRSPGTPAGQVITLYRVAGGHETYLASARTSRSGSYSMSYRFAGSGPVRVITRSSRTADNGSGASAPYDLTVR
ncbi:MAG: hypothetical protein NVSMB55_10320 [Mycobacteriales bacterium]